MSIEKTASDLAVADAREDARDQGILTITRDGVTSKVRDQGGLIAAAHRTGAFYEQGMLTYIASLGLEGVYVDVGASVGNHTVFFAQHCPSTAVHAFEPLPRNLAHLAENVALNGLGTVGVHPYGLSERAGRVTVRMNAREYTFDCRTLDSFELPGPVVVLKVDIEGMEVPFLKGARATLRRHRPVVFAEAGSDAEYRALRQELGRIGYEATGRVFNRTPTYEFSHVGRREQLRRRVHGLLAPGQVKRRVKPFVPRKVLELRRAVVAGRRPSS